MATGSHSPSGRGGVGSLPHRFRKGEVIRDYLAFLLLGLGAGAVYAAVGLGLVLAHRASGVVNFAHGAMAMVITYLYVELRSSGDLVLPVVGVGRLHLTDRPSPALALVVALAAAAVLGLVVHGLVFRPLRAAPALARVVASVGLMVTLQALALLRFGPATRSVPAVLPARPLRLVGLVIPADRLALAGVAVAAGVVLSALYRTTRFGLASRAAAEDETSASLLGLSPDALAAVNWVLASVLAGLGGILVAPITALNPVTSTLLVVPALAAAAVGRLSSFAVTVAAALGLGMAQAGVVKLQAGFGWVPRLGVREGLPLVVIVAAMALRGSAPAGRGVPPERRLPVAGRPRRVAAPAAVGAAVGTAAVLALGGDGRLALVNSMIGATICLSLVVLTGYAGQISLAQMAFAGVAGFCLSQLAHGAGVPFPLAPLLAATSAALVGLAVGVPARRVHGVDLAVVTIAAAVAVEELVFKNAALTGGFRGRDVPPPALPGVDLGIGGGGVGDYPRVAFALLVLAVLVATAAAVAVLRRGRTGRRLLAVRANERAAAAAGIDVAATKIAAFAVSAFVAGIGGTLVGYQQGRLSFDSFGVFVSLSYLAVAYLGGIAGIGGAVVGGSLVGGGVVFTVLDRVAGLGRYRLLVSGVALVAMVVLHPEGIAGAGQRLVGRRARREER